MAKDLNKVMITGRLGRDPELRYTQSGEAVATFSVASGRPTRDEREQSGWREETEWFRVVTWQGVAERAAEQLTKGNRVYVEGRLQTREYTDKQGQRQRSIEVIADDFIPLESRKVTHTGDGAEAQQAGEWETGAEAYYPAPTTVAQIKSTTSQNRVGTSPAVAASPRGHQEDITATASVAKAGQHITPHLEKSAQSASVSAPQSKGYARIAEKLGVGSTITPPEQEHIISSNTPTPTSTPVRSVVPAITKKTSTPTQVLYNNARQR